MTDERKRRAAWVATAIMPHEVAVRRWLASSRVAGEEIDDLVQEAYCKLADLPAVDGILNPRAYFFQVVRNLLAGALRRARVVKIETVTELEALNVFTDQPSPEHQVAARRELSEVLDLIDKLPSRCRTVFQLRKIHGLSQREIAQRLGITETMVENDVVKGLRLISRALLRQEPDALDGRFTHKSRNESRVRRGH
jgi:RNA polymerase sigma-70 factor (ECF subfamily)